VSDKLRYTMMSGRKIPWSLVQMNSIQLWDYKIKQLGLLEINETGVYYLQEDLYDKEILGVMKYVLKTKSFIDTVMIV